MIHWLPKYSIIDVIPNTRKARVRNPLFFG